MTASSILKRQCSKDMRLTLHRVGLGCLLDQSREVWTMAQRRLWSEEQYKSRDITIQIHRYSAEHHANLSAFPGPRSSERRNSRLFFRTERHEVHQYFILE